MMGRPVFPLIPYFPSLGPASIQWQRMWHTIPGRGIRGTHQLTILERA